MSDFGVTRYAFEIAVSVGHFDSKNLIKLVKFLVVEPSDLRLIKVSPLLPFAKIWGVRGIWVLIISQFDRGPDFKVNEEHAHLLWCALRVLRLLPG